MQRCKCNVACAIRSCKPVFVLIRVSQISESFIELPGHATRQRRQATPPMSQPPMPFDTSHVPTTQANFLRIHSAPARTLPPPRTLSYTTVTSHPFCPFLRHAQLFSGCGSDASLEEALLVAGANITQRLLKPDSRASRAPVLFAGGTAQKQNPLRCAYKR